MPELSFCTLNPHLQYTKLLPHTHLLTQPVFSPGSSGQPSALDPIVKWDWKYLSIYNGLFWNPGPETSLCTLPNLPFHGYLPSFLVLLGHWLPESLTLVSSSGPSSPLPVDSLRYITQIHQPALFGTILCLISHQIFKNPSLSSSDTITSSIFTNIIKAAAGWTYHHLVLRRLENSSRLLSVGQCTRLQPALDIGQLNIQGI